MPTGYPPVAGPVGYGAALDGGRGTIVAVDLTSLMVLYWVVVLLIMVVEWSYSPPGREEDGTAAPVNAGVSARVFGVGVLVASAAVTGHTVVYSLTISVVTWPSFDGQSVTEGAQDVMV